MRADGSDQCGNSYCCAASQRMMTKDKHFLIVHPVLDRLPAPAAPPLAAGVYWEPAEPAIRRAPTARRAPAAQVRAAGQNDSL